MLLFKPNLADLVLAGQKTVTRRTWKKARVKSGSIHLIKTKLFSEPVGSIRILNVRQEQLGEMTDADALAEGFQNVSEFVDGWERINGPGSWHPDRMVWVVEFELHSSPRK